MTRPSRFRRQWLLIAAGATTAAVGLGSAVAVATTSTPAGGTIHVFGDSNGFGGGGTILVVGAIGDHGTSQSTNAQGKVSPNGSYVKLTLSKGTILLNKSTLDSNINRAFNHAVPNKSTCSLYGSASGPVTAVSGSGAYASISGSLRVTVSIGFIAPRKASGACNMSNSARPVAAKQFVTGSGTVSFK